MRIFDSYSKVPIHNSFGFSQFKAIRGHGLTRDKSKRVWGIEKGERKSAMERRK